MKVKCINLKNQITGDLEDASPWLTLGKTYSVLQVLWGHVDKDVKFRIEHDDNKSPALSSASFFEIVSDYVPSTWCAKSIGGVMFSIAPRAWHVEGFWLAYFDGEEWAKEIYQAELEKLMLEETHYLESSHKDV